MSMSVITKMSHGGDRYRNHVELDYSINLNPLGMPESVKEALLQSVEDSVYYPDLHYQELREAIAKRFSIKIRQVVCGNGASELLMAVVHALKPKKVLLPVPSFSGYQWVLDAENVEITPCFLGEFDERAHIKSVKQVKSGEKSQICNLKDYDMIFLTNPNNPTGRYWDPEVIKSICQQCEETGTIVVLDECFMELSDEPETHSLTGELDQWKNLLILRAFTKSFAIPGVRLGYLMSSDVEKIAQIEKHLPEWNLSVMAQKAGMAATREMGYLEKSRQYIAGERTFLKEELKRHGFEVEPSVTNFMLIRVSKDTMPKDTVKEGAVLYKKLLERGILIRDCSDYQGLPEGTYRIAVRNHEENVKFIQEVRNIYDERKFGEEAD